MKKYTFSTASHHRVTISMMAPYSKSQILVLVTDKCLFSFLLCYYQTMCELLPVSYFPKVVLVRVLVDKEVAHAGVTYNITFGHTALGKHAIDVFTSKGLLAIIQMATRFVAAQVLDHSSSTVTTSSSETD